MSDSVQPQRRQPTRLPHPWDSPGKNTGVGCHFLLQIHIIFPINCLSSSCCISIYQTLRRTYWNPQFYLSPSLLFTIKVSNLRFYLILSLTPKIPHCSSLKILTNIKNTIKHQKCYQILWYLTIQKFATHEHFADTYLPPLL